MSEDTGKLLGLFKVYFLVILFALIVVQMVNN